MSAPIRALGEAVNKSVFKIQLVAGATVTKVVLKIHAVAGGWCDQTRAMGVKSCLGSWCYDNMECFEFLKYTIDFQIRDCTTSNCKEQKLDLTKENVVSNKALDSSSCRKFAFSFNNHSLNETQKKIDSKLKQLAECNY